MTTRLACLGLLGLLAWGGNLAGAEPGAREKSVTVFPVSISPSVQIPASIPVRIAEVVGLQLERAGMTEVEIQDTPFPLPAEGDVQQIAAAFGTFVRQQALRTSYALYAQFMVQEMPKIQQVRTIVVDRKGQVVLAEQAGADVFARSKFKPENPLSASLFVVERLGTVWDLADPMRDDAPQGKMAERMRQRSGIPPRAELDAMQPRLEQFQQDAKSARVTVYPAHLWVGWDADNADRLAKLLTDAGLCQATAVKPAPAFVVAGDPNEQKILWDTARAFRQMLREHPAPTPYALLVDYGLGAGTIGEQPASHVHIIVCQRDGQWVLVDFQNSHHPDFQHIDPKTIDDCNRLVIQRWKQRLGR